MDRSDWHISKNNNLTRQIEDLQLTVFSSGSGYIWAIGQCGEFDKEESLFSNIFYQTEEAAMTEAEHHAKFISLH